jgi:membrane protein DedA with SNARE-associated domain
MDQWIEDVLGFISANRLLAGPVVFGLAFAESMAFLSLLVPFTAMIVGAGALVGSGALDPWIVIPWGIAGASMGDAVSYWIGRYFKDKVPGMWPFRDKPDQLERGYQFFARWGVLSVFIGRFFGPLRAVVPVVAGMLRMSQWKFQVTNVVSAVVWLPALLLPGAIAGTIFRDVTNIGEKVFGYVFLFFVGTTLVGALFVYMRQRRKKAAAVQRARGVGPAAAGTVPKRDDKTL